MQYDLVVAGGGAAGFFGAIQAYERHPDWKILILEKSPKLLSKVRISGGGRCNVTHHEFNAKLLAQHYPRGEKQLRSLFKKFQAEDTVNWFRKHGVQLKTEPDGRMFPVTNSSLTIIDCFLSLAKEYRIEIETNNGVEAIEKQDSIFTVYAEKRKINARNILIAMGGHANAGAYEWIRKLHHTVVKPIPSLFTFNDREKKFTDLMGLSVPDGVVKIAGTKFYERGPVLITHWGLSGPAVIKLSAWAAEYLHERKYEFDVLVSWIGDIKEDELRNQLDELKRENPKRKIITNPMFSLPQRLWTMLCEQAEIEPDRLWGDVSHKQRNKLIESLIRTPFHIRGKTTFKEEFVTCGGVDLSEVSIETMESKLIKGLFFAGEVLHIDGETGGFNFQAAWTTSFIAAQNMV